MSSIPDLPALDDPSWYDWAGGIHKAAATVGRTGFVTVASVEAPASLRDICDYVCDGVDDQVQINAALLLASRPGDGFGGAGHGAVQLVGPTFYIGNNGAAGAGGAICMYPSTSLYGTGRGTLIRPMWASNVDRGCIELIGTTTDHIRISNLVIGRPTAVAFNGHGIKLNGTGSGNAFEIKTGNDPFNQIDNVFVLNAGRCGIWCTGSSGGSREMVIRDCVSWNAVDECFYIDSSSDSQIIGCRANGGSGGKAAFRLAGGNTMATGCKAYYSESPADGFAIESSRCQISHCSAQDNGRHGFNFTGGDVVASNLIADSNSRLVTNGRGFVIATNGTFSDLEAFDRGQTPSSPQLTQFEFSGTRQVYLTGRSDLGANGTTHVSGTPAANSFVRIVRQGTTLFTAG